MEDDDGLGDAIDFWLDEVLNYLINHNKCTSTASEPGFKCYYYRQVCFAMIILYVLQDCYY